MVLQWGLKARFSDVETRLRHWIITLQTPHNLFEDRELMTVVFLLPD